MLLQSEQAGGEVDAQSSLYFTLNNPKCDIREIELGQYMNSFEAEILV